jgi:hypothetical protein
MSLQRLLSIAIVLAGPTAYAGRTPFAWSYGTEVNPERMVESETWISEENKKGDLRADETLIWWGPTVGITSHLEGAIPIEFSRNADTMTPGAMHLQLWGGELRYRFNSPDPIEAGPVTALLRVAALRMTEQRDGIRSEADFIVAIEQGRFLASVDLGTVSEHTPDATSLEFRPSLGVSVLAVDQLRLGVEAYSELNVQGDSVSWLVIGPSASWTHGRFWLATALGEGIVNIHTAPRVKFGIQF